MDIQKNLNSGIKTAFSTNNSSHPDVQQKIDLLKSWVRYFFKQSPQTVSIPISESLNAMEVFIAIYEAKRNSFRASIVDAIFDEANKQIDYALSTKN